MNIGRISQKLMMKEPLYGLFLLHLNKYSTDKIPTAAVVINGINTELWINEEFWESLPTDENKVAILKHELIHICFHHLTMTSEFQNKELANIAMDLEVNQYIENLPEGALLLTSFPTLNLPKLAGTKEYYKLLNNNLNSDKPDPLLKELSENKGGGFGESSTPESGEEGEGGESNNGKGQGGKCKQQGTDKNGKPVFIDHSTWEEISKLSDNVKDLINKQIEYSLKEAAEQVIRNRGSIPGELQTLVNNLMTKAPSIFNWKAYFRRLIGNAIDSYVKKTRKKESNRFVGNAGIKIKRKHKIFVAIDTSGSVSDRELLDFFVEINHIYKAGASITIAEVDAKMNNIYEYDGKFSGKISGRGGTTFDPAFEYYNHNLSKYSLMVYFTDGYAPAEHLKSKGQVIWVITSNGNTDQKYNGHVINIPSNN